MQSECCFVLKAVRNVILAAGCLWLGIASVQGESTNQPATQTESPIARIISENKFGLSDAVEVEVQGTASELQPFTADQSRLVLLFDGSPLRQMATNIILVNPTFSTNHVLNTNMVTTTNVIAGETFITYTPTVTTNAAMQGHPGMVRVEFLLARNDANRNEWNRLLGSPNRLSKPVKVAVGIESNNTVVVLGAVTNSPSELVVLRNEPSVEQGTRGWTATAWVGGGCLVVLLLWFLFKRKFSSLFDGWIVWCWIGVLWAIFARRGGAMCCAAFLVIFFFGFLYLANCTELLRDSGPKPPKGKFRTYSLARFQMAFWFFLSVCAFVFLWMITDSKDTITGTVLTLMGIGAGTALGAEAQNQPKIEDMKKRVADLKDKQAKAQKNPPEGTFDENDKCELKRLTVLTLDVPCVEGEQKRLQDAIDSLTKGLAPDALNARLAELAQVAARTAAQQAEMDGIRNLLAQWQSLPQMKARVAEIQSVLDARPVSKDFFSDILTDDVGISFHRFQMFVWTIVCGIIFVFSVYRQLAMPQYNETLLALMGISSGTYLGFMYAEKPTGTQTMTSK
jgi:hypothetical protein